MQATLGAAAIEASDQAAIAAGSELPALPAPPSAGDKPEEKTDAEADKLDGGEAVPADELQDEDIVPDYDSDEPPY